MSTVDPLSERLQGIVDSLTVHAALIVAQSRGRLNLEQMDELRHWIAVAVRGAALEGARNAEETRSALLPVPKVGRAHAQEMRLTRQRDTPNITISNTSRKLPDGV